MLREVSAHLEESRLNELTAALLLLHGDHERARWLRSEAASHRVLAEVIAARVAAERTGDAS